MRLKYSHSSRYRRAVTKNLYQDLILFREWLTYENYPLFDSRKCDVTSKSFVTGINIHLASKGAWRHCTPDPSKVIGS